MSRLIIFSDNPKLSESLLKGYDRYIIVTTQKTTISTSVESNIQYDFVEQTGDVDAETMKLQTDTFNSILGIDMLKLSEEEKKLIGVCANVYRPISRYIRMIYYNITRIKNIIGKDDSVFLDWSSSNKYICLAAFACARTNRLGIRNHFGTVGLFYDYVTMRYAKQFGIVYRAVNLFKFSKYLFFSCISCTHHREEKSYELGVCYAEDSLRHFEWLLPNLKKLEKFNYRIICTLCPEQYKRMIKTDIEADKMENWLSIDVLISNSIRYLQIRRLLKKHISNTEVCNPYSRSLIQIAYQYLYCEMYGLFLWNAIYESYFWWNRFALIEPFCTSNYPQTVLVANNSDARLYRYYDFNYFKKQEIEAYPNIFSYTFFSEVGIDLKSEWDDNLWGGERFRCSVKQIPQYNTWENEHDKNTKVEISVSRRVLFTISGYSGSGIWFYTQENCEKRYKIIESVVKELKRSNIICRIKVHPNMPNEFYAELKNNVEKFDNCEWIEKTKSISEALEGVDLLISDLSTTIIDAFAKRIPALGLYSDEERLVAKWQEEYIDFLDYEKVADVIKEIEDNYVSYYHEQIDRQNCFFEPKSRDEEIVDMYSVLRDIADKIAI